MNWEYVQPVRIIFGNGQIKKLTSEIAKLNGSNGLLVTTAGFVRRGMAARILQLSGGTIKQVYSAVSPNPTVEECDNCASILRDNQCDFVVALGGGSVIDCAKAAATFGLTSCATTDFLGTGKAIPQQHLPIIAMPTTSGTASEVTCVSVLSDHNRGIKSPMNSYGFYPTVAIVDPELTLTVPPHLTATTGFDVLCHAIEAYWSVNHQPVCSTLAVHAAHLALTNLRQAYKHGDDLAARENMAEASVTAGLAFTLPKTTSAHACSYPLTNLLGIAHGEACALTITHFIRFNANHGCERVTQLAHKLGYEDAEALANAIDGMREDTGMLLDLKSFHLDNTQLEQLIQGSKHPNLRNNPVPVSEQDLREMYESMI